MPTRAQIQIIQEGLSWNEKVTCYKHSDGYPEGVLPLIKEAFAKYGEGYEVGRAGKVASFLCAVAPGLIEPEEGHELHGDIEYYYRLYCINGPLAGNPRWEIEIFTTEHTDKTRLRKLSSRSENVLSSHS